MGSGQEPGAERMARPRRRRRAIWLLSVPALLGATALGFCLWNRRPGPQGTTVVSLQALANRGVSWIQIWADEEPRCIGFLAGVPRQPPLVGTAGPWGDCVTQMQWAPNPHLSAWRRDSLLYINEGGAVCVRSPYSASPRKLAELPDGAHGSGPVWSPDGRRLAILIGLPPTDREVSVRMLSADGDFLAQAKIPTVRDRLPRLMWSPSGRHLLVCSYHALLRLQALDSAEAPDWVLLSEPHWEAVPINCPTRAFHPRAWASDELLAGTDTQQLPPPGRLRFVRALSGEEVAAFDCGAIRVGGPRTVVASRDIQPAPSQSGVIGAFAGYSSAFLGTMSAARYARVPRRLGPAMGAFMGRMLQWTPPRVAYVYVSTERGMWRTIAIDEATMGDDSLLSPFTISTDGTELLYVSNWELKAAPLPAEARADATKAQGTEGQ